LLTRAVRIERSIGEATPKASYPIHACLLVASNLYPPDKHIYVANSSCKHGTVSIGHMERSILLARLHPRLVILGLALYSDQWKLCVAKKKLHFFHAKWKEALLNQLVICVLSGVPLASEPMLSHSLPAAVGLN
jgi:hypothetical protein